MRYPLNYGVNPANTVPAPRADVGGCPYACPPPDYDYYQNSGNRQLLRRFTEATLTFAAKASYLDGETLVIHAGRYGESAYGDRYQSKCIRYANLTFEFDVTGNGVAGTNIALDISAVTTAAQVASVFLAAWVASGTRILKTDTGLVAGTVKVQGTRPGHSLEGVGGTGYGAGKTTVSWVHTAQVGAPPLIALAGRGAWMAPQYRSLGGVGGLLREGRLMFGNHTVD